MSALRYWSKELYDDMEFWRAVLAETKKDAAKYFARPTECERCGGPLKVDNGPPDGW